MRQVTLLSRMLAKPFLFTQVKTPGLVSPKPLRMPSKVQNAVKVFEFEGWRYLDRFTVTNSASQSITSQMEQADFYELLMKSPTNYNYLVVVRPNGIIEDVKPV